MLLPFPFFLVDYFKSDYVCLSMIYTIKDGIFRREEDKILQGI